MKNIFNPLFNAALLKILDNYNRLVEHKLSIQKLCKEKFDKNNRENVQILLKIWEILKGNTNIELIDPFPTAESEI